MRISCCLQVNSSPEFFCAVLIPKFISSWEARIQGWSPCAHVAASVVSRVQTEWLHAAVECVTHRIGVRRAILCVHTPCIPKGEAPVLMLQPLLYHVCKLIMSDYMQYSVYIHPAFLTNSCIHTRWGRSINIPYSHNNTILNWQYSLTISCQSE